MKQGDFTQLAKDYIHRPGYSEPVLRCLAAHVGAFRPGTRIAEVGAGTGKLTELLIDLGLRGVAVEPNDAMRAEGQRLLGERRAFEWRAGSGEETGLPPASADWLLMASSFHWTDHTRSLPEFHRVLKPGGSLTVLWNPRDLDRSPLQRRIDDMAKEIVKDLKRVSSGGSKYTDGLEEKLVSTGHFEEVLFVEAAHDVEMSRERYMGAWRSVNDIQAQAGPEGFSAFLAAIEELLGEAETVKVPYRTRAWTVRAVAR